MCVILVIKQALHASSILIGQRSDTVHVQIVVEYPLAVLELGLNPLLAVANKLLAVFSHFEAAFYLTKSMLDCSLTD